MQAPGGPEEDTSGGFEFGGWVAPYDDDAGSEIMQEQMKPADLLLGRKTFDIFASYWPEHAEHWPGINEATKYVMSSTREKSDWVNCVFLKSLEDIQNLKNSEGSDLKVWGSSKLVQFLLKHDLVDELWLKIHPLMLGKGKKLFDDSILPAAFTLAESMITISGVIIVNYKRAGDVKTGTIGG
jgi:dihydrofolate reductase